MVGERPGPDATQPRVTVRPKPPVLLGAASTVDRWHAPGSCRTTPARAGLGDSREATVTHHGPPQNGSSSPLRSRTPGGARSHPSIPPCSVLSASVRFALRLPFGLPSLPPFSVCLRFGGLLSPNCLTGCASRHARSMGIREIQTFSPLFSTSSPSHPPPSPVHPQSSASSTAAVVCVVNCSAPPRRPAGGSPSAGAPARRPRAPGARRIRRGPARRRRSHWSPTT